MKKLILSIFGKIKFRFLYLTVLLIKTDLGSVSGEISDVNKRICYTFIMNKVHNTRENVTVESYLSAFSLLE